MVNQIIKIQNLQLGVALKQFKGNFMKIDHFAVPGMKLEEATEYVESTLGYKMEKGGKHKLFGTHNNLLGLKDGMYIEAIAVDPAVKNLNFSRWFNLKINFFRLSFK